MEATRAGLISVCLPIRNEERYLRECLDSLLAQEYPLAGYEIIAADGGSTDATRSILEGYAARGAVQLRIVDNPAGGVAAGRNAALRAAGGDYIVFVEGHAWLPADFLSQVSELFARTGALCLGRRVEQDILGDTPFQRATGRIRASRLGRNPYSLRFGERQEGWVDPTTVATVYRREVFERFGVFDESFATNEDVEFNWRLARAGVKAYQSPALTYYLHPRDTWWGLTRQMYRYGRGKAQFVRKHPEAMRVGYALPSLALATGAGLLAASIWCRPAALAVLAGALAASVTRGGRPSLRALAIRCGMVGGFGWGLPTGLLASMPCPPRSKPSPLRRGEPNASRAGHLR
jgi:cellulose synthase/poly-beta-1,6-N-acetylglucosamine synthase-like glycosyltransferase